MSYFTINFVKLQVTYEFQQQRTSLTDYTTKIAPLPLPLLHLCCTSNLSGATGVVLIGEDHAETNLDCKKSK